MKHLTLALSLSALITGCATLPPELPTQSNVNLQQYAGTWYEQARLPNSFQTECTGAVRADYTLNSTGGIDVRNQCETANGTIKSATAEGRLAPGVQPPDPAKLEVRFAPAWTSWLPMVWGDYWIIKLADNEQYSLVGTPDRQYLWVLSRQPKGDPQVIQQLLDHAKSLGFNTELMKRQ